METAAELRKQFRALPKGEGRVREAYNIRVWRALSWLERAQGLDPADIEGRFISAWIGFNALYGRLDPERHAYGDREAWSTYLANVRRIDVDGKVGALLRKRQLRARRLIEDKYLSARFWLMGNAAKPEIRQELKNAIAWFQQENNLKVQHLLFDRLYVMRNQLLHGASTKGSKLNRRPLREAGDLLIELLAEFLSLMIARGSGEDWGELCFPPGGPEDDG